VLADARQVKNLPGRPKRDPPDSAWLAACFERGAVTACFAAAPEFRLIRLHTRCRRDLTEERTREKNRAEKLLEPAAIKLSSVLTGLHGVTGRDIMGRLIAGQRDPKVLAQLARGRARAKISQLAAALEGAEFFTAEHAALPRTMLGRIDRTGAESTRLSQTIERLLAPWKEKLAQAESMPGWRRRSAEDTLAETGPDMTRFPTGAHLASWAGRTPLDNSSGKRPGKARSKKGNRYLAAVTGETPVAAGQTATREGARYRRLARRRGKANAQAALGNTQPKACHALLPPRHPLPGPRAGLLRTPARHPPPDRPPRRQARRPRLRGHPRPHPRPRTRRRTRHQRRLTSQLQAKPNPGSAALRREAAARPAEVPFSGQPLPGLSLNPPRK
jgi:transposase